MKTRKVIIGLEVHIELKTRSKMFCGCCADHFGKEPNTLTCPVCLGLPGALPVPNKKAIEWTILLGLAVNGKIQKSTRFDRKNYFYPDLPKGYQISQYDQPFILGGFLVLDSGKTIKIKRVHLEEDTGKLLHEEINGERSTLIDYNRSGVPLVEIVTEPDVNSSIEAKEYLEKIQQLVRYLSISDADMEKGSMRCEPNINLEIEDKEKVFYTPIVELKNINSFRFAQKAIDYEVKRQFEVFSEQKIEKSKGNKETRGWDEVKQKTVLQRAKEEANDYRYFPEPDIPPIEWTDDELKNFESRIKNYELPWEKKERYERSGLSSYQANVTVANQKMSNLFDETWPLAQKEKIPSGTLANVIINKKLPIEQTKPQEFIDYIKSSQKKPKISGEEIDKMINKLLTAHPEVVEGYKKGKPQALGLIVGIIRKNTGAVISVDEISKHIS